MLARMYFRWAEKKKYKIELISESQGDEAGIKSCCYKIVGNNAYGWLRAESGVHRLVRIPLLIAHREGILHFPPYGYIQW